MEKLTLFLLVVPDRIKPQLQDLTDLELAELFRRCVPHARTLPVFILNRGKQLPEELLAAGDNRAVSQRLSKTSTAGLWWYGTVVGRGNGIRLVACPAHTVKPGPLTEVIQGGSFTPCIVAVYGGLDRKAMQAAAEDEGMTVVETVFVKEKDLPLAVTTS